VERVKKGRFIVWDIVQVRLRAHGQPKEGRVYERAFVSEFLGDEGITELERRVSGRF
jgi:hypothetical protein